MSIGLSRWVRPIAYCEIDPYCQAVLVSRISDGLLPNCPIWDNVKTLRGEDFRGSTDIIYGGFPCQDISVAGNGKGLEGERSGLFFEIVRLAKEIKPRFIFLENVPAITKRGGVQVIKEITEMGYDCRWCIISAASIGAIHFRERWFLLAHSNSESKHGLSIREKTEESIFELSSEYEKWKPFPKNESSLLGMDDELYFRMDRTRALGNSVVPKQAKKAFKLLMGIKS